MKDGRGSRWPRRLASGAVMVLWAAMATLGSGALQAQTPVAIELVLAVDISRSVDDHEFDLQMTGIARAFRHPEIIELIGQQNGVAVALFQWSGDVDERYLIPWTVLKDPASILSFAARVESAERNPLRGFTGIGRAIDFGVRLITENGYAGRQMKIDISGDGRDNIGTMPPKLWPLASALGIVINGLPVLVDTYHLDTYYREKVIAGPGAFIESAVDYDDFTHAFLRKLRREVMPAISRGEPMPATPVQLACARRQSMP